MKLYLKFCHHAKVPATSTQSPIQAVIFLRVGTHDGAVSRYQSESFDIIAGQSKSACEPSSSAAQNQS